MDNSLNKNKYFAIIKELIWITLGTIVIGTAVYFFMMPSHLIVASITGIAIILEMFCPLSVSTITLILNMFCLVLGFLLIGKEFGGKTIYTSILLPAVIGFYERVVPGYESVMKDPFVDLICYLFLVSLGLAMLFTSNASSGGLDIIVKILNKYFHMDFGKGMTLVGMVVSVSAAFFYDPKTVVLGILGTYLNGIVLDHFIMGFDVKFKVCIVSEQFEKIKDYVIHELGSGATIYELTGAYTMEKKRELVVIVDNNEYGKLMKYMQQTDGDAFITIYTIKQVQYKPKQKVAKVTGGN